MIDIQLVNKEVQELNTNPTSEGFYKLIKKYGAPYRATDRGTKYYKDLVSKYLQGLPINDDKLFILLGLNVYGSNLKEHDVGVDNELIEEIKDKVGLDPNDDYIIDSILSVLLQGKYLEDNPTFIPAFNEQMNEQISAYKEKVQ